MKISARRTWMIGARATKTVDAGKERGDGKAREPWIQSDNLKERHIERERASATDEKVIERQTAKD
ncbi:hypothetical protein [uncultured Bacteroides sp.]|uniref:hypothetical protein n=1 Tax=uncultured Bacteroides sp. TaxID=162156 RepID=UPI00262FD6FD|nr:hypothetical protein [uncultured Bacteroides sp.]